MTRVIAINLLLIFLPLIIYGAYIIIDKKPEDKVAFWKQIPLKLLFSIGFALMLIFYVTQITFNTGVKDGIYHPAIVKDGKVIPGYIEPFKKDPLKDKALNKEQKDKKN
ncbi:hypothetical protein NBRC116602_26600 [Hyphomicrobiales bacterium 4NK60-0047b]